MAFKITVTAKQAGKEDVVEEFTVSRQAFVQPAISKLKQQQISGKQYTYETVEVK